MRDVASKALVAVQGAGTGMATLSGAMVLASASVPMKAIWPEPLAHRDDLAEGQIIARRPRCHEQHGHQCRHRRQAQGRTQARREEEDEEQHGGEQDHGARPGQHGERQHGAQHCGHSWRQPVGMPDEKVEHQGDAEAGHQGGIELDRVIAGGHQEEEEGGDPGPGPGDAPCGQRHEDGSGGDAGERHEHHQKPAGLAEEVHQPGIDNREHRVGPGRGEVLVGRGVGEQPSIDAVEAVAMPGRQVGGDPLRLEKPRIRGQMRRAATVRQATKAATIPRVTARKRRSTSQASRATSAVTAGPLRAARRHHARRSWPGAGSAGDA